MLVAIGKVEYEKDIYDIGIRLYLLEEIIMIQKKWLPLS